MQQLPKFAKPMVMARPQKSVQNLHTDGNNGGDAEVRVRLDEMELCRHEHRDSTQERQQRCRNQTVSVQQEPDLHPIFGTLAD